MMPTSALTVAEVDGDADADLFESVVLEAAGDEAGMRVDKFLAEHVPGQSRSYLASLCAGGFVTRCGDGSTVPVALKKSGKVKSGDVVEVRLIINDELELEPEVRSYTRGLVV